MLRAPWKKIVCTTVDISVKTQMTKDLIDQGQKKQLSGGEVHRHIFPALRTIQLSVG